MARKRPWRPSWLTDEDLKELYQLHQPVVQAHEAQARDAEAPGVEV